MGTVRGSSDVVEVEAGMMLLILLLLGELGRDACGSGVGGV
jgi:hypothetical protein